MICNITALVNVKTPHHWELVGHLQGVFHHLIGVQAMVTGDFNSFCMSSRISRGKDQGTFNQGELGLELKIF